MDSAEAGHVMSEDDAENLEWLISEFGQFGPDMFETIQTEYKKFFPGLKPVYRTASSVKKIVENILSCVQTSNERAIASGDEKVAGDIAYKNIMRKFYIKLFLSKYYESIPGIPKYKAKLTENVGKIREMLIPILFESQTNFNAWLCDKMDKLIEYGRSGFPEPPKTVLDEAESARLAVTKIIEERRMQQQMQSPDNQTTTFGRTAAIGFPPVVTLLGPQEPLVGSDEELKLHIREKILDFEKSEKINLETDYNEVLKLIFSLPEFKEIQSTDTPANRAMFHRILDIFYIDLDSLLKERGTLPPSAVFLPLVFTPGQLKRKKYAEDLGWTYGPLPRGYTGLFPAAAAAAAPAQPGGFASSNGGNKKIKSKKTTKKYSKSRKYSKKHSTRRRRRNSYKK